MQDSEMLAGLMAQAEEAGGDLLMLRAIVEEASLMGAQRALDRIGLADAGAGKDVRDLRALLDGWRDAKRAAGRAAIGWIVRVVAMLVLVGLAARADLLPLPRL